MTATGQTTPGHNTPPAKADTLALLTGDKKTKSQANYRPSTGNAEKCDSCKNYQNPGADESPCLKVVGLVRSSGVCDLWATKPTFRPDDYGDAAHKVEIRIHTGTSAPSTNRIVTERPNY